MTALRAVLVLFLLASFSGFGQTVSITASTPNANEAGLINGEFTVSVTGAASLQNVTVILSLNGASTATEGDDFSTLPISVQVQANVIGNGSTTVPLVPEQDFLVENDETVIWDIVADPPNYTIDLLNSSATVTILDNDVAGILVNGLDNASGPATGTTTEDGGTTADFLFTLTSEPSAAVTIPLNNTRPDEGSVQADVTLDATNWDTGVTVTVTGVDEFVDDGDVTYTIGTQTPITGDVNYDLLVGADIAQISITNENDDVAEINASLISNDTSEDGTTATFDVVLTAQPLTNVVLDVISGNTNEGTVAPISLTFTNTNWDERQTVTVTGVDDFVVDGSQTYDVSVSVDVGSSDAAYTGVADELISVTNLDDDSVGINVAPTSGTTSEDGTTTATFTFTLDSEPTAAVTIPINGYDATEGSGAASVVLDATNWDSGVDLVVTGVDDSLADGDITYTLNTGNPTSGDANYDALTGADVPQLSVTNTDDDSVGINVAPTSGTTSEDGTTTATFTFTLDSEPTGPVTIPIAGYDGTEGTGAASVVLNATNWDTGVDLVVTGVDDAIVDGDISYTLVTGNPTSPGDANYDALGGGAVDNLDITNTDDDSVGINLAPTSGTTSEDGTITATFTFTLDSEPTAAVTIPINGYDATEGSGAASVVLDATNWDTGVDLVVTGVDDSLADGDITYTLNTGNPTSGDANYDALTGADVPQLSVTNTDDDVAGVQVNNTSGSTTEIGGAAVFRFTLDAQPDNDVTIALTGYDGTEGSGPSEVVLTPTNWQIGVQITIMGEDDTIDDGDITYTVVTSNVTSADPAYDALDGSTIPDLQITNEDNDQAQLTISDAAVNEDVGTGVLNLPVTLDIQKPGGFSVDYTLSGGSATPIIDFDNTGGTLIFLGNASETVLVVVPIVDDNVLENSESFTVQLGLPTNDVALAGDGSATGTILDDDNCLPSPILDTSVSPNFCDVLEADLDDYISNAPPAGAELIWSTSSDQSQTSAYRPSEVTSPGTYFGFFLDEDDDCFSPAVSVTLVINITPGVLTTTPAARCGLGEVVLGATGDVGATLNWYDSPTSTNILGTGNSFTTPTIAETTSFYVEATANGCPSEREEVVATVNIEPSPGIPNDTVACSEVGPDGTTILDLDTTLTGADLGAWAVLTDPSNGGVAIDAENNVDFQGLPLGDYVFVYTTTDAQAPCTNQSVEVTITVIDCLLDADFDGLNDDVEEEIGTDPNNPDTDGDGIEDGQEVNVDGTDPLDDCDSLGGIPLPDTDCDNDGLTNAEENDLGTDPFDADSDDDGLTDGEEVLVEDDPSTEAIPENPSDPLDDCDPFLTEDCNAEPIDILVEKFVDVATPLLNDAINFTITITNQSLDRAINIVIADVIDDSSGFELLSSRAESGTYDAASGLWNVPELLGETSVSLFISVRVIQIGSLQNTASLISSVPLDGDNSNDSATVDITVSQSECVNVGTLCNLFSPNGDGVNDVLLLVGSEIFPNNRLQVFDRYGNSVFEARGYDNTWDGTGDNGNLPKGTYYYILDLGDGSEVAKGWIQIIR